MFAPKFNGPIPSRGNPKINMQKLEQVKGLLQRRYKQCEIAELMGMTDSALSDYMSYHGLRKPK